MVKEMEAYMKKKHKYLRRMKKITSITLAFSLCICAAPVSANGENILSSNRASNIRNKINSLNSNQVIGMPNMGSISSYDGEENALSDAAYKEFGFSRVSPDEFNPYDTTNPLEGYESTTISELIVGVMNGPNDDHWEGRFKVFENTEEVSADAFNFNNMDDHLVGKEYDYSKNYPKNGDDVEVQTANACAVDYDGDGVDEIAEMTIYTDYGPMGSKGGVGYMEFRIYDLNEETNSWEVTSCSPYGLGLSDDDDCPDPDFTEEIEASSSKAYCSIAAGDYDGDGLEEVALYVASQKFDNAAYISIVDITSEGQSYAKSFIRLSEFNSDGNKFDHRKEGVNLPIVSLSTTSISGQDDLVVIVSHPRKDSGSYKDAGQDSAMKIFHWEGNVLVRRYTEEKMTYSSERLRFASAVDADLNGNGIDELIVGGYINNGWDSSKKRGEIDKNNNFIQAYCWNENSSKYEKVWSTPKKVTSNNYLQVDKEVTEPAALTAGKMIPNKENHQIFLEGVIFEFSGAKDTGVSEKDRLKDGNFVEKHKTASGGNNSSFISQAYMATFSTGGVGTEQIAIIQGDHVKTNNDTVYYDVCFAWYENGQFKSKIVNNDYIKSDEDDNGTFIYIAPIDCDHDKTIYEYQGKEYGWSAPKLYAVLQSPPYWRELKYNTETYGAGSLVYSVKSGWGSGSEGNWGIGAGLSMDMSLTVGMGAIVVDDKVGGGISLGAMGEYVGSYGNSHMYSDTYSVTLIPGNDYAITVAVPMVKYNYKVWVPDYKVTQEVIDAYNECKIQDPDLAPFSYKVGETVPGKWETTSVQMTLEPTYTHMTVDEYNELAKKYELTQFDKSLLGNKVDGDPTTYPKSEDKINKSSDAKDFYLSKNSITVAQKAGEATQSLAYEIENSTEEAHGFELDFNASLYAKATSSLSVGVGYDFSAQGGVDFHLGGGASWVSSSSEGTSFTANVVNLPSEANDTYGFTTRMYVYHLDSEDDLNGAYVSGFIVTEPEKEDAPPAIPTDFRVMGTTAHEVLLKWSKPTDRPSDYYEIYMLVDGQKEPVSVDTTNEDYFVVKNLMPNTYYQFAIKCHRSNGDRGIESVLSRYVGGTTKSVESSAPYFSQEPESFIVRSNNYGSEIKLKSKAEYGEGIDTKKYELTYKWQKYSQKELSKEGEWQDIEGATNSEYTLPVINLENVDNLPEQTHYRVVATQKSSGDIKVVTSRVATVFIDKTGAHDYYYTEAFINFAQPDKIQIIDGVRRIYYTERGKDLLFDIVIGGDSKTPRTGKAAVAFCDVNAQDTIKCISENLSNGSTQIKIPSDQMDSDCYYIRAVYPGGLGDEQDNRSYFLASQSATLTVYVVDVYRISYHLDGGMDSYDNPLMLCNKSMDVTLTSPYKKGYEFDGWYYDSEFTNKLENNVLEISKCKEQTDIYAKWVPTEYVINYELDGGTNNPKNPATYNVEVSKINLYEPSKEGYEFKGWYEDNKFSGEAVTDIKSERMEDVTVYAKWEESISPFMKDEQGNYLIGSYDDLVMLAKVVQSNPEKYGKASYLQTNHINCKQMEWALTIGTQENEFLGTYDGRGYYILSLRPNSGVSGIFGVVGSKGTVKNVSVVDMDFEENQMLAGGIAGINKGLIDGCSGGINLSSAATTVINGKGVPIASLTSNIRADVVGGIAGRNEGIVKNCHSNANLTGRIVGGIVGENTGDVLNGYNTGQVTGSEFAGGIVGVNSGNVAYAYNADTVSGGSIGAIAGSSKNGQIKDVFYRSDMACACSDLSDENARATALSKADMRKQSFADTLNEVIFADGVAQRLKSWAYSSSKNMGYPTLSKDYIEMISCTNERLGVSMRGSGHVDAQLRVIQLDSGSDECKKLASNFKNGTIKKAWKLALMYPDGTYGYFEGPFTLTVSADEWDEAKEYGIIHLSEDGVYTPFEVVRNGNEITVSSDTLGVFALTQAEGSTSPQNPEDENPNDNEGEEDGENQDGNLEDVPATADTMPVTVLMVMMVISVTAMAGIKVSKRRNKIQD